MLFLIGSISGSTTLGQPASDITVGNKTESNKTTDQPAYLADYPIQLVLLGNNDTRAINITSFGNSAMTNVSGVLNEAAHAPFRNETLTGHILIDFEKLNANKPGSGAAEHLFRQYADKGIVFNDPVPLDYSSLAAFTHSGLKAIEQCYGKEFCTKPIEMTFTHPQKFVKVWVGYREGRSQSTTVILRALNAQGVEVGQTSAILSPSSFSQSISTPLQVSLQNPSIVRAVVSFSPETILMNNLVIDDVEFDTAGPPPQCESMQTPTLTLIRPQDRITTESNAFTLEGSVVTQNPLEEATVITTWRDDDTKSLNMIASDLLQHTGGSFGPLTINEALRPGFNTVVVKAKDCQGISESGARIVNFTPFTGAYYTIHIHAIRTADDNGSRAADINSAQVQQWVDNANEVFEPGGMRFELDPIPDEWLPLSNTTINNLDSFGGGWNEANSVATQFPGKLVVFFRHGYVIDENGVRHDDWHTGNGFSNRSIRFIAMPGFLHTSVITGKDANNQWIWQQNKGQLAHDIGHYFALDHTFPGSYDGLTDTPPKAAEYIANNGGIPEALDGDRISDTPPEAGTTFYINQNWNPCVGNNSYIISGGTLNGVPFSYTFSPDRHNVMSYFACEPMGFTPMQFNKMRQNVESRALE